MPETNYVYVFVRADLSFPQQAVQAIHAAIEATKTGLIPSEAVHPHLVLCTVPDERHLIDVSNQLSSKSIKFKTFIEPDRNNEATALATGLIPDSKRRLFRKFPLLKEQQCCDQPEHHRRP